MSQTSKSYEKIWLTIDQIPIGKVASYGQVADLAGLPGRARLVGKSLGFAPQGRNVAWYKVLRSNGQIAFSKGSDQALLQTGLLQEDGVMVLNNRVKLTDFQWQANLGELLFGLQY
jgi:methylated-DNA-protein-cysteine methyltransferase-like protein